MSTVNWAAPFQDLEPGARFASRGRTVTESDVVAFAALTGDWHPQHSDAQWAAAGRFGERIAHGMLVLSYAVGLVALDPERVIALRRICDVVFKRPVRLGDTIRVTGALADVSPLTDEAGLVAFDWAVRNQQDALVCRARVEVLWRGDEPAGASSAAPDASEDEWAHARVAGIFPC